MMTSPFLILFTKKEFAPTDENSFSYIPDMGFRMKSFTGSVNKFLQDPF